MASLHVGKMRGPAGFSRIVAIKRLNPVFATNELHVRMALEEARICSRIQSAYVVPVLDLVEEGSNLLIVMELVRGPSLASLERSARRRGERIPPSVAVAIMTDMLQGLHAAHEAKDEDGRPLSVVHRDISPQNILVGSDGVSRVVDFGVAKALGTEGLTRSGELKGKLGYMAPEQLSGLRVTRQVDVFAAGVVLWEALAGERLLSSDNIAELVAKHLAGTLPTPSSVVSNLPRDLDDVVMRALSKEPQARFATAEAMAMALEEAMPPAPRKDVAAFVERLAFEDLEALAEATRAAEAGHVLLVSGGRSGTRPVERNAEVTTLAETKRSSIGAAVCAVAVVAACSAFLWHRVTRRPSDVSPPAPPVSAQVELAPPQSPAAASASSGEAPAATADTALGFADTPPVRTPARIQRGPAASRGMSKASPASPCSPPYTYDGSGHKHYKPSCIP